MGDENERSPEEIEAENIARQRGIELSEENLRVIRETLAAQRESVTYAQRQTEQINNRIDALNRASALEGELAESRFVARQRDLEMGELRTEQMLNNLQLLQQMVDTGAEMSPEQQAQYETLKKSEKVIRQSKTAYEENNQLIAGTGNLLEDKVQKGLLRVLDLTARDWQDSLKAIHNTMSGLADTGLNKLTSEVKDLIFEFDSVTKGFEKQFQLGEEYTDSIEQQYRELNNYGVSLEEAAEAQAMLATHMTDFTMLTITQRNELAKTSAILGELGVSQQDFAQGVQNSVKFFGVSAEAADNVGLELAATARELGVAPEAMAAQFASAGGSLAKFGEEGVQAFKDLSRIQKITGMEMEKVLSITNRFDTFEGAAEQAGQLNAALGGNFVNAMDLMTATDPAERFGMVRDAITDAGLSFDEMSYYQKQFYAESLGLSDVGDLALMLSGDMDALAGSANKTQEELLAEAERAREVQTAQEQMSIAMAQVSEAFLPLAAGLQWFTSLLAENEAITWTVVAVLGAWKLVSIALAVREAFRLATMPAQAAGIATIATATQAQVVATAELTAAVGALATAEGAAIPVQTGFTGSTVSSSTAAAGATGPFAAFGIAALKVGAAVLLAGAGVALMAFSFSLLSTEQLIGLPIALLAMAAAAYIASPAIVTLAGALVAAGMAMANPVAAAGLLVLTGAIWNIAGAVFVAAAGIALMGVGLGYMFSQLDLEKALGLAALIGVLAITAPFLLAAGAGFALLGGGMLGFALALKFISTRDLEAMASFTASLAETNIGNVYALVRALRGVADAMDDIPLIKTIALTATMSAAGTAAKAARMLAGQPTAAPAAATPGAAATQNNRPIDVNVTLELDGEVLDRRIVRVNRNSRASGGPLSAIAQIV